MALLKSTPLEDLREFVTPMEKLFVVAHLGIPETVPGEASLELAGLIDKPCAVSLRTLRSMKQTEVMAAHECAGNPLHLDVPVRRVANVAWRGVLLRDLFSISAPFDTARYIWAQGADAGIYGPTGVRIPHYQKDIPLGLALDAGALIALEMNAAPLSAEHGAPFRLVVPGFYGTNSVKWLRRMEFSSVRSHAYFSAALYNDMVDGKLKPVWSLPPHSLIVEPSESWVPACESLAVWGWAWGAEPIVSVHVSMDGATTWRQAVVEPRQGRSWQRFQIVLKNEKMRQIELVCRAVDASGMEQPAAGARNCWFRRTVQIGRHGSE